MSQNSAGRVFQISGMTCGHCVAAVEAAIRQVTDVLEVSVDLKSGRVVVFGNPSDDQIIVAVEDAGYEATLVTNAP